MTLCPKAVPWRPCPGGCGCRSRGCLRTLAGSQDGARQSGASARPSAQTQLPLKCAESRLPPSCSPGTSRAVWRPQCAARVASCGLRAPTTGDPPRSSESPGATSAAQSSPRWASGEPQLTSHPWCEPGPPAECFPGKGSAPSCGIRTQGSGTPSGPSDPGADCGCDSRSCLCLHPMRNMPGTLGGLRNEGT